jgi:MobL relaxases
MGVFFHILSTGVGSGASRTTRYIAERDKDLTREGPGSRPLFSEDQENLTYHKADRILDPYEGHPEKSDLIHFSVMVTEKDFDKLGADEKEKQARFREMIREGMKGMAGELNVEELTWVAGIHRNSQNPHTHIVMSKNVIELGTERPKRIARIPKHLLPYRDTRDGKEAIVSGRIGDRFVKALENQQSPHKSKEKQPELTPAEIWERLARKYQKAQEKADRAAQSRTSQERHDVEPSRSHLREGKNRGSTSLDHRQVSASWNPEAQIPEDRSTDFRLALGKQLALECRLAFAEVWHDRAVQHGTTYRFDVVDQSIDEDRKISELDVRRRAAARATRLSQGDHASRNDAIEVDLARHAGTLEQLAEARETKIAALGKDIGSLRSNLGKIERSIAMLHEMPGETQMTPLVSRQTLSELQEQAVKLNLPDRVAELERLRIDLAREHQAPTRTDTEDATLAAQLNVSRADFMAKDARIETFEASVHLTSYEVGGDRWSLAALDKQISRRQEDSKLIPHRAARLDLRSLARLNYSATGREQASAEVEHLTYVRGEIVRQIEQRRAPLVADRDLARDMVDVLENAYTSEQRSRIRSGLSMLEPKYERYQITALEGSAETLKDPKLLREVHEWEKNASKTEPEIDWEGRAVAREITSHLALEERRGRLQHFLESKKVASLHVGEHRTGTLREVEARTLTEYLARAITESREHREFRQTVKIAAREHHGRLINDFEKASDYHDAARELASEAKERNPQFNDKEKINLEIYAERQNDPRAREQFLGMARGEDGSQEREISASQSR